MKRANGTGTIVKKAGRAKPWIVYGGAYRENGKRVVPFLGSYAKKADAQSCLDAYNQNPQLIRARMTFEQIYTEFKQGKRYRELSKSQKDCYAAAYKHCAPLYRIPFSELRTAQFQNIIDTLEAKGLSISTLQKVKVLLTVLTAHALQTDAASKNYAGFIVLPSAQPSGEASAERSGTGKNRRSSRIRQHRRAVGRISTAHRLADQRDAGADALPV